MSGNSQLLKERIPKYLLNLGAIALAVGITFPFLDKSGFSFSGFIAYFLVSIAALLLLRVGWRSISNLGPPQWLQLAVIIAVGIRLLVGVGLFTSLPKFGYQDSKPHQTGYIYQDAYERDKDAWRFAISEAQLLSAWTDADLSDQYGGLHFISTSIYRIISIDEHRPLLIVLLTATFGSLAILFTWSSSKRMFGDRVATVAVWIVALYPEAVLLSASQMREPFLITALALGLDGYSQIRAEKFRAGMIRSLVAVLIALVLSPPFSLVLIGILAFAWLSEGRAQGRQRIWATISVILLGAAGIVLTGPKNIRAGPRVEPYAIGNALWSCPALSTCSPDGLLQRDPNSSCSLPASIGMVHILTVSSIRSDPRIEEAKEVGSSELSYAGTLDRGSFRVLSRCR
jgi:hypothetical protein